MLSPSCWRLNSSTIALGRKRTTAASNTALFLLAPSGWLGVGQIQRQAPLVLELMLLFFAPMVLDAAPTFYSFLIVAAKELLVPTRARPQIDIVVRPSARSTLQFHNQSFLASSPLFSVCRRAAMTVEEKQLVQPLGTARTANSSSPTARYLAPASHPPLIIIIIVTMMAIAMMMFLSSLSSSQSSVTIQTSWKCNGPKKFEKHTHINLSELKMNSHPVILTLLGVWSKPFQGRDQMISKILLAPPGALGRVAV